jgi:hypothetical protein
MNLYLKPLIFLLFFSALHFGYDLTGWNFLIPFCGVNESLFQHLKMAFWAYLLLTTFVEYPLVRKKMEKEPLNFWYSRLLSTIILPWFIIIIWYLQPALFGKTTLLLADLIWAIGVTYFSALVIGALERDTEKIEFSPLTKYILLLLLLISGFLFIWFTYRPPWIDLFINPEGL